ncbi:MAG: hypothetical protein HQK60_15785, partial [Deltaproteobacteria bacterium]|nr:hypothetical protein [Deltaproteobacteria bacterium]
MNNSLRRYVVIVSALVAAFSIWPGAVLAANPNDLIIPPGLEEWTAWVLHGQENKQCPTSYNDGQVYRCSWPSRLNLVINAGGGNFKQEWLILAKGWVPLPGGAGLWPQQVQANGENVAVITRNGVPSVRLKPGRYVVAGSFTWNEAPEMISVPPACGLISLSIEGKDIDFPAWDKTGRLWLKRRVEKIVQEDRLDVRIQRLVDDAIPMEVTTHAIIDVSGRTREIQLDDVLLPAARPMNLTSPLPARINPDGTLLIQARPGHWDIQI